MPKRKAPLKDGSSMSVRAEEQSGTSSPSLDDDIDLEKYLEGKDREEETDGSLSESLSYSEEEDSDDDDDIEGDGAALENINVDFQFCDPVEEDFHGLKVLLTNFLDGRQWACSELVDAVLNVPQGSTVIKCGDVQEDEEEEGQEKDKAGSSENDQDSGNVIGVIAVLPIQKENDRFLNDIRQFVVENCKNAVGLEKIEDALTATTSTAPSPRSLLMSERFLNSPPQLAPPLLGGILEELEKLDADERPKMFVFMTRAYVDPSSQFSAQLQNDGKSSKGKKNRAKKAKKKQVQSSSTDDVNPKDLIFVTPEGEFCCQFASWSYAFDTPNRPVGRHDLIPKRVIMGITTDGMKVAIESMKDVISIPS